jgi:hypothetical protein
MKASKNSRLSKKKTHAEFEKKLLSSYRRFLELNVQKRSLPLIALEEPIQKGWKRYYELRSDIKNRRDAHDLQRILGRINSTIYCRNQDFKTKDYRTKKYEKMQHPLNSIHVNDWDKLGWPGHYKKWFRLCEDIYSGYFWGSFIRSNKVYRFEYPWMFTPVVVPNMMTHRRAISEEIEQELAYISAFLDSDNNWHKLNNLLGIHNPYRYDVKDIKKAKESLKAELDYIKEND